MERLFSRPGSGAATSALLADVDHLSTGIGPRPTGTVPFEKAVAWGAARLREALGGDVEVRRFPAAGGRAGASVLGTLPGGSRREEIVLLAAHLDSTAESPGAADDAAGVAIVLDAARALSASRPGPARSVRFALFGGEEEGMWGSSAYVRQERDAMRAHAAVLVVDAGAGPFRAFASGRNRAFGISVLAPLRALRPRVLGGLHALDSAWGGCDALDFLRVGVPVLAAVPREPRYAEVRHTPRDLLSPAEAALLPESAGIVAALAWVVANADAPPESWRLDARTHGLLLGTLAADLALVRSRDAALDAELGPLPAPLLRTSSAAPTARPGATP